MIYDSKSMHKWKDKKQEYKGKIKMAMEICQGRMFIVCTQRFEADMR